MIQIKPIKLGLPTKEGVNLLVRILSFETTSVTAQLYWEVQDLECNMLANENIQLSEEQYCNWGDDNTYLEDIVLKELGIERN